MTAALLTTPAVEVMPLRMASGVLAPPSRVQLTELLDQDLPNKFAQILHRHQVQPSSFCLEITESALIEDLQRTLDMLREHGFMYCATDWEGFATGDLAQILSCVGDDLVGVRRSAGG